MKNNHKILIVDDEPENLKHLVNVLEESNSNFSILQANNIKIAIHISKKEIPDIIITDWNMPNGSGIDLIQALKKYKLTKDIPVIVATGFMLSSKNLATALNAGAIDFIRKPIDNIELEARVNAALLLSLSYKENIRLKNIELNENALYLVKCNKFNIKLIEELKNVLNQNNKKVELIENIIGRIQTRIKSDTWEHFDSSFEATHSTFYKNLIDRFPSLTKAELRVCALLMLGMSTKNISSILNLSPDSVKVSRYRIRKKLNLNNKENLQIFLTNF